ncbi:MAG: SusD/RagB family nutrient-binding outer membrane lipoprotein [Bacteroidales bacterium]|nr:SusD/RagB family nutrient-binding outer membrane lipoprotein [Bacteroidales bacterium]HNW72503.1 SusD/RagB family nutrient-binding outer membrane lipoprotein [Bacteroidales bacterium]HPS50889.1 SusD/RagB family nutrient-binding outer membrane lipoprotein [Bacteroidales bacterium]
MKTIIKLTLGLFLAVFVMSCTKNFDKIDENPNQPAEVGTPTLLTGAMKGLCDDIYDEWWGGRQSMLWAQYWCQRNYPSEDRFAIRQNINNQYWRLIYHDVKNLVEIIDLNTNPETKAKAGAYGDNQNQIAVATILKVWAMQIMADTWGDIPYQEAFQGDAEAPIYTPKYDKLQAIYANFLTELKTAVDRINLDAPGFLSGDNIYGGDMGLWKKFGNSLRLRVAMRMSATDNYAAAKAIFEEVGEDGLILSNMENAKFPYIGQAPNNSPLYDAYWTNARNDFTTCKTLVNLLKGVDDTLNAKPNPFHGMVDPRLQIYSRIRNASMGYIGMPYGMTEGQTQQYWAKKWCPSFYGAAAYNVNTAIVILNAKYAPVFMEAAEVEFMLSELNSFSQEHYEHGVRASMEHWRDICVELEGRDASWVADYNASVEEFLSALPAATKETVLTQKYLAFYNQGYQAWAEYRRTGQPSYMLKPGEHTSVATDGSLIDFIPLVTLNDIPRRLTYPQQEFTVNGANATAAAAAVGGDLMSTKLWWEPTK